MMIFQMRPQSGQLIETFIAVGARVEPPFFSTCPTIVHPRFVFNVEKFPALFALMRFIIISPRVFHRVQFEMLFSPEFFRAKRARIWMFGRVRGHVHSQSLRLNESLSAYLTHVRFDSRVYQQVLLVIGRVRKRFIAHVAFGFDYPFVNALNVPMKKTFTTERFIAHLTTHEFFFKRVSPFETIVFGFHVRGQIRFPHYFPTQKTFHVRRRFDSFPR